LRPRPLIKIIDEKSIGNSGIEFDWCRIKSSVREEEKKSDGRRRESKEEEVFSRRERKKSGDTAGC